MAHFLETLAHALLQHHPGDLSRVAVVLPGRVSGAALRKYLAQATGRVLWSPDILDMAGFMQRVSGMRQGGPIELLADLYRVHTALDPVHSEAFDEFVQWAPVTLRDMSEVDAHLLPLDTFYRELQEMDEIEEWSLRLGEPSAGQQRLIHHWRRTAALHRAFHTHMRTTGVGTAGMVARVAVERIGSVDLPWDAVWFAGLAELSPAATRAVQHMQQRGMAHLAWDVDHHYLDDAQQEAGLHLRRAMAAVGAGVVPPTNTVREAPRTVHATTVPTDFAQVIHAVGLLEQMQENERLDSAIVLADPELLVPLLQVWPATAGPVHVTMGVPLRALPVHGLMEAFLQLHTARQTTDAMPVQALERLLAHPLAQRDATDRTIVARLRKGRRPFLRTEQLREILAEQGWSDRALLIEALQPVAHPVDDMPARTNALIAWASARRSHDPWGREQLFRMAAMQSRLDQALRHAGLPPMGMRAYAALRTRLLRDEHLDLEGRDTKGVLITDMAGARTAGRHIHIVLGAREGLLPPADAPQSWIPFDIRRHHQLPLAQDTAARSAYELMQVLRDSTHLHLVHANDAQQGGPTRFLAQWAHELVGRSATHMEKDVRSAPVPAPTSARVVVAKTAGVMRLLEDRLRRGLSPSALGAWLQCPLEMFHTEVLGLREQEVADGRLGSDVLGTEVHEVLEMIYAPWKGQLLRAQELARAAAEVHDRLRERTRQKWSAELTDRGHYRLRLEMAAQAMQRYLEREAERCARGGSSVLIDVEGRLEALLPNGVRIIGRYDRVEERDGVLHILDMKTGATEAKALALDGLEREHLRADRRYALQLLVYAWAYMEQHPQVNAVRAAIVPLRQADANEGMLLHVGGNADIHRHQLPQIAQCLMDLVQEIGDPGTPLSHEPRSTNCKTCVPM
jgi:hypothetical protein